MFAREKPKVLVVGATGFVGRHVLAELEAWGGAHVIVAGRDVSRLPPRCRADARVGDLRDAEYVQRLFTDIDVVCLTASWSALYGHTQSSESLYRLPILRALTEAVRQGVRRVVFTSALVAKNVSSSRTRAVRDGIDEVWPHLHNLLAIEATMQELASSDVSMIAVRLATFTGEGQDLGILPVLVPRLRTRLVPWIERGQAPLPMIDGADVGRAFRAAVLAPSDVAFAEFDATGPEVPTFFDLVSYLHETCGVPLPWFDVSHDAAFRFGHLAEMFARWTHTQPLLTRSIVFLSESCREDRTLWARWEYQPQVHWKDSVLRQLRDIARRGVTARFVSPLAPPTGEV